MKKEEEEEVVVSIKDTGQDIDPQISPRLFTKFEDDCGHTPYVEKPTVFNQTILKFLVEDPQIV